MERIRILTAVPICDGHDSAINTINLDLIRYGIEVIYLGFHRSAHDIVRAAIQEDVRAIGLSSYNGGHVEFFSEVLSLLRGRDCGHIRVFGGGGATITKADADVMYSNDHHQKGVWSALHLLESIDADGPSPPPGSATNKPLGGRLKPPY